MKNILKLAILLSLAVFAGMASATTHYIRTDGGSSAVCNGTSNAPVSAAPNCALSHPYYLVTDNTTSAAFSWSFINTFGVGIASGDTVQFEDVGPYYIGLANGGVGINWLKCAGDAADCFLPPMLNGVSIKGFGAGACHNSSHTTLVNPTQFIGINAVYWMWSFDSTADADFECFDFSQPSMCTESGEGAIPSSLNCTLGTDNYAQHGVVFQSPSTTDQGPIRLTFKDFQCHGLANECVTGQKFNSSSGDVTNISDVYLYGNANTGWDGDTGACGISGCWATGTINATYVNVYWSGCMEVKPNGGTIGGNGVTTCVDQAYNGNGDNIVMVATNGTWNWSHITSKWGAQDCFDGLHMGDNPSTTVQVNINQSWSEGCEGQQFKLGGNVKGTNLVAVTNCRRLNQPFPPNPSNYSAYVGLTCRAFAGLTLQVSNGESMTYDFTTIVGYASPFFDIACNQADTTNCPANSYTVNLHNNIMIGYDDPESGGTPTPAGLFWETTTNPFANPGSGISNNDWSGLLRASSGGGVCPQETTYEVNTICTSPLLVGQSSIDPTTIDGVNPNLTSGSPAIGAGITISGVTTDYNGVTRPNPPSIGSTEFVASGGGGSVNGSVSLSGTITISP